jgi:hypothetical protein
MSPSAPPAPTLGPVDLSESVAGEEDPGAAMDLPLAKPATGGGACPSCGGSGKIASGTCPECKGTGKRPVTVVPAQAGTQSFRT